MLDIDFLRDSGRHIGVLANFPLPALVCDRSFQVYWSNPLAKTRWSRFSVPGGLGSFIAGFDGAAIFRSLELSGNYTLPGSASLSGAAMSFSPLNIGGSLDGAIVIILDNPSLLSGAAAEAVVRGVRADVAGIIDAMDAAYLRTRLASLHPPKR